MCTRFLGAGLAAALLIGACTGGGGNTTALGTSQPNEIAQPVVPHLPVAPESQRVDLRVPTFTHPTEVTNSLFPVSKQASVLFLGHVDGKPFRTEVTLLPRHKDRPVGGPADRDAGFAVRGLSQRSHPGGRVRPVCAGR